MTYVLELNGKLTVAGEAQKTKTLRAFVADDRLAAFVHLYPKAKIVARGKVRDAIARRDRIQG